MSGIEIVGLIFGAIGFAGSIKHVINKRKEAAKMKGSAHYNRTLTQSSSSPTPARAPQKRPQTSDVALVHQSFNTLDKMHQRQDFYNRATLQVIDKAYQQVIHAQQRTVEAYQGVIRAKELDQRMHVEETRRFTNTLGVMWFTVAGLTFALGYYIAENRSLRTVGVDFEGHIGVPFPVTPGSDVNDAIPVATPVFADDLLKIVSTFLYGILSGYLYIPLALVTVVATPFNLLYTLLSWPSTKPWFPPYLSVSVSVVVSVVITLVALATVLEVYKRQSLRKTGRQCPHARAFYEELIYVIVVAAAATLLFRSYDAIGVHPYACFGVLTVHALAIAYDSRTCTQSYIICLGPP